MKKIYRWIIAAIYVVLIGIISYFNVPELTKNLLNGNDFIIIVMNIFSSALIFVLTIWVISFIYRVVYKIVTKVTLDAKESRIQTLTILLPLLYTRVIVLFLIYIVEIKSNLIILPFLNPYIYIFQFKQIKSEVKNKFIILLPFIIYEIIDIITIYCNNITG